ncbi:hypothetical protein P3X46_011711 [Hevea brasiliensis]|uniref:Uncharacterized protein n=1 Tax=Hevea brasiliensis TaxID=3981 RepID=A0ABQ9MBY2_HEVBR|nr:uncharacterized protein LOC110639394 isoform X2 [Hevea brasiliensis]KAJ9176394.1 hypothetical protein P3X46_011711 [Hevea brasiliensis]
MAVHGARRTLQFSSASAKALLTLSTPTTKTITSPFASKAASLSGLSYKPSSAIRLSLHKLNFSRLPVELGGALSLIPLHSVTASALFTSLLSLHNDTWGCLSEGFATPL